MWRNSYGRLFTRHVVSKPATSPAGPDSLDTNTNEEGILANGERSSGAAEELVFKFSPEMGGLINPRMSDVPIGTDGWAIAKGWISVTPLRASFAEPPHEMGRTPMTLEDVEQKALWKFKL